MIAFVVFVALAGLTVMIAETAIHLPQPPMASASVRQDDSGPIGGPGGNRDGMPVLVAWPVSVRRTALEGSVATTDAATCETVR